MSGFSRTKRRARRVFLRRWNAPKSTMQLLIGKVEQKTAWKLFEEAFFDGIFDEIEARHRREAEAALSADMRDSRES